MTTLQGFWRRVRRRQQDTSAPIPIRHVQAPARPAKPAATRRPQPELDIRPDDPLLAYFQQAPGLVDVDQLDLASPALDALRAAGVRLVVPLVSQGELIGLINLGPRLSEQDYSALDRKLLNDLATQAAPAVRVAQLARQQQLEARQRERIESELRVARLIQQTLLPHALPDLPGYEIAAHYQPAREVGGDFYDFLRFDDGRIALIIGDVTDKGVPAALVMATTRTLLRASAERLVTPGRVLEQVNELLHPDIPPRMFVTCLYALLDPTTGRMSYANAGHDLPYRRHDGGVDELRATGMPLGLMPGMLYEEKEIQLSPGETVLFHSDGLVEAHNPEGEMFSFRRLQSQLRDYPLEAAGPAALVPHLLYALAAFTEPGWEQEDDVTLVVLHCHDLPAAANEDGTNGALADPAAPAPEWQQIGAFSLPSAPGNERIALEKVADHVGGMGLPAARLERLKTAVAEATMNAMEHGNGYQADKPVRVELLRAPDRLAVRISDQGDGSPIPHVQKPDLEAKLRGLQSPRGWGLFLIESMVDEMNIVGDQGQHTIELIMMLNEGDK
ncbi:MAG: SpoIIE family protein phosphatase [Candidatus Promineifilaceae bacterium]|nr:SpoIIE family protein phosphatase [Candidatus Promineifilaceae bacterium]